MTKKLLDNSENNTNINIDESKSKNNKNNELQLLNNIIQAKEEILLADNNENPAINQNQNESLEKDKKSKNENSKESINTNINNNNNGINGEEKVSDTNNLKSVSNKDESIIKEEINFDDIFSLNLEYKKINSSNAKNLFGKIFEEFKEDDKKTERYKASIMTSLVDDICLKLNCNKKEEEKKNIENNIKLYLDQDEDFEDTFYIIFDNIINHEEESTKIIDNENEDYLKNIFKNNKDVILNIIKDNNDNNKIRIDRLYDILFENNIKIKKNVFLYLCYKLKTDNCDSLFDVDIKGILKYVE
jgi:hypothetical protein